MKFAIFDVAGCRMSATSLTFLFANIRQKGWRIQNSLASIRRSVGYPYVFFRHSHPSIAKPSRAPWKHPFNSLIPFATINLRMLRSILELFATYTRTKTDVFTNVLRTLYSHLTSGLYRVARTNGTGYFPQCVDGITGISL